MDIDFREEEEGGTVFAIFPYIAIFSFISIIFVSMALMQVGLTNDYVFYNLQNVSEDLANNSVIDNSYAQQTQAMFDDYRQFPQNIDYLWFGIYLCFVISSLMYSYKAKSMNYIGMFGYLFFGLMFLLFIVSIVIIMTDWWETEILLKILPTASIYVPIFSYYMNHIGIFVLIQTLMCFFANIVDFDISRINFRKKKEEVAMDSEVL